MMRPIIRDFYEDEIIGNVRDLINVNSDDAEPCLSEPPLGQFRMSF